jgi:hypothetical protein
MRSNKARSPPAHSTRGSPAESMMNPLRKLTFDLQEKGRLPSFGGCMIFLSRFSSVGSGLHLDRLQILGWVVVVLAVSICARYDCVCSTPIPLQGGIVGRAYAMVRAIDDGTCGSTLNTPPR